MALLDTDDVTLVVQRKVQAGVATYSLSVTINRIDSVTGETITRILQNADLAASLTSAERTALRSLLSQVLAVGATKVGA